MDIVLPSELERKLARLAEEQGRDRGALVVEAIERLVDHDAWFVAEVERGLRISMAGVCSAMRMLRHG